VDNRWGSWRERITGNQDATPAFLHSLILPLTCTLVLQGFITNYCVQSSVPTRESSLSKTKPLAFWTDVPAANCTVDKERDVWYHKYSREE
jgi:hypothetical protein